MPEFTYGDKVRVANPSHKDFGKIGRVVENPTSTVPWVTLTEDADDPYGMRDAPVGVEKEDYHPFKTSCYVEADLEMFIATKTMLARDVPIGVMFSTPDKGGKFLRISPNFTGFSARDVVVLVVESLDSTCATEPMTVGHFDRDFEVVVELE